jgi:hypothetical protein
VFGAAGGKQREVAQPLPAQDFGALLNALTVVVFRGGVHPAVRRTGDASPQTERYGRRLGRLRPRTGIEAAETRLRRARR